MAWLPCAYFDAPIELSDERLGHIRRKHPELDEHHAHWLVETIANPQRVYQRTWAPNEFLLTRRPPQTTDELLVVVVVVEDEPKDDTGRLRRWVVTAYIAFEGEVGGEVIWETE